MHGECCGICKNYQHDYVNKCERFFDGYMQCRECQVMIKPVNGNKCPCCGNKMASKPKGAEARRRFYKKRASLLAKLNAG